MKNGNKSDKPKRPPFHEEFAEKIIERLKEGTAPWQQPWHPGKTIAAPHNPASGTVYRGMNRVHLALSGYDDPRWMTLRQANEKDMRIMPGSKATPVVYFQFSKEQDRLGEDGKPVLGEDGKPEKMTVELDKPIMRFAHVFNAEQIEGMPPLELTDKAFEWEPVEKAENILSASGANINHDQSNRAFYRYGTDSIHLPPRENFEEPGLYYGTALHELGHWTRHSSRLDRENGPFGSEMYAREELRAEIASWMLGQDIGIPHDPEHHASYVNSWVKALEDDPYEIVRACRDAEQIKEYILGLEMKKELAQEQAVRPERNVERDEGIAAMGVPANPATEKTFLAVPYKEKEQAKKLGAKWDKDNKLWYAPEGTDLNQLSAWLPEKAIALEPQITMPPQEEFSRALEQFGLDLGGKEPIMDGQIHRVPIIGKSRGDLDGAYCGFLDERPAGWMQDFSAGEKHTWAASDHTLTKEQLAVQRAEIARKREERQQAIIERQHSAARDAHAEWIGHDWATAENAYLQKKGVPPLGVREDLDGNLMVPAQNVEGDLRGLQYISPEGQKRFQSGMEKNGNYHLIAEPGKDLSQGEILLAEGYATGASLHMATEKPVGGKVVAPIFNEEERARGLTDFNDLHQSRGLDEVKKQVGLVLQQATDKSRDKGKTRELAL
ncbi:DNA primase TraC (Replication primase) [uncultured delta proteobacterium]|uniref:DNA primase TraC (Replication primase) n=1 Tax=uncultured delta proteobacterium TaxID=34034 RepID=A0A212K6Z4_9DELT|nr:DNA primase TraC (Replication primase) [uncultured delta proteobacterium]